jgi:hypothetical protein
MKKIITKTLEMQAEEVKGLLIILVASLLGISGAAVYLMWATAQTEIWTGFQSVVVSLIGTLIFSGIMGGIVYLLQPKRG